MKNLRRLEEVKRGRWLRYPYLVLTAVCLFSFRVEALEIDLSKIRQIESSGNPQAVSPKGCIGLYQISGAVLAEYNKFHKTNYTPSSLIDPSINERIAKWYLTKRIPSMLKYYHKKVSVRNILISYNAGINYVVRDLPLPLETVEYLIKYNNRG